MLPDFRVRQRDYLLEITRAITRDLELDHLLARIVKVSVEMLAGQAGIIALRDEEGRWLVTAAHGTTAGFIKYLGTLLAQIQVNDDPIRGELPEITRIIEDLTKQASSSLLTYVGLPLIFLGRMIGVIFIFRGYPSAFSANDRTLLQSFADQAAIAVHNAQTFTQVSREKRRMDALLDTMADGILILKPNTVIERTNPAFRRLWGNGGEELNGKRHEEVIRWRTIQHGMSLEQAGAGGWPLSPESTLYVEGDLERPNGNPLPVGVTYAPLMADNGPLLNIVAAVRDISHFRQAEEIKSTFISVISHELKTPVALIKGYVATLRREDARWDREVVKDSLQVIEEEADRLSELIENLLDASRLEAGGFKLNQSEVDLSVLAKRLVDRFHTQSEKHRISAQFPQDFPTILGDDDRLFQVLSNLLSNAIKYSPDGGDIRISGSAANEQVTVCVTDEGAGIPAGDAPHVFDRFYRTVEAGRTTKGAGLGLYLARAVVEAHGGHIWVDTRYNSGARICFSLPRTKED